METQTAQQEREIVWEFLDKTSIKFRDSDANEKMLLDACERPVDYDSVARAFVKVQHQLAPSKAYVEAYEGLFAARPELRTEANISLLDSLWNRDYEMSADGLLALAEHKDVKNRLCFTANHVQAQQQAQHRAYLIQAISLGKPTYECLGNNDGRIVNYKSDELHEETDERLEEILEIVSEYRRIKSMSVAELQNERKQREFERVKALNAPRLPATWTPKHNGDFSQTGPQIIAYQPVALTADTLARLHPADMRALVRSFGDERIGWDLANAKLGVKPAIQHGSVQVIQR